MRVGLFEVILIDEEGKEYEEICFSNIWYVIAQPGKEYSVKVLIYKNNFNQFPAENMRIGL